MRTAEKHLYHGEMLTLQEISRRSNVPYYTLCRRMNEFDVTAEVAAAAKRKTSIYLYNGKLCTAKEIADEIGMPMQTLYRRLHNGVPIERAIQPDRIVTPRAKPQRKPAPEQTLQQISVYPPEKCISDDMRENAARKICQAIAFHQSNELDFAVVDAKTYTFQTDNITFEVKFAGNIATMCGWLKTNAAKLTERRYRVSEDKIKEVAING